MRGISKRELEKIEASCRHNKQQYLIPFSKISKYRTVWALMLMYFCFQWANYFFVAWMPVYLQEGRHFSEAETKHILFALFMTAIIGLLVGGFIGDWLVKVKGLRAGRRIMGFTGMCFCGGLIYVAAVATNDRVAAYSLVAANGFYGLGVMSCFGVCSDIGGNNAGTVSGFMNFSGQLGAFFLAIFFGKIAETTKNLNYPLFTVTSVVLVGCLFWLFIDPLKSIHADTANTPIKFKADLLKR